MRVIKGFVELFHLVVSFKWLNTFIVNIDLSFVKCEYTGRQDKA